MHIKRCIAGNCQCLEIQAARAFSKFYVAAAKFGITVICTDIAVKCNRTGIIFISGVDAKCAAKINIIVNRYLFVGSRIQVKRTVNDLNTVAGTAFRAGSIIVGKFHIFIFGNHINRRYTSRAIMMFLIDCRTVLSLIADK